MKTQEIRTIRLLNNGGFYGLEEVEFPVEVKACVVECRIAEVPRSELLRLGATANWFSEDNSYWSFRLGTEAELVE